MLVLQLCKKLLSNRKKANKKLKATSKNFIVAQLNELIDINKNIIIKIFTDRIFELCKSAKRPQCNPNFMNKIGERSNTAFSKLES